MLAPDNLLYSKSHEWLKKTNGEATVGITFFAQDRLGDITYVGLPSVGASFGGGEICGSVESIKSASDLYAPADGEIISVNEELDGVPDLVNKDPYGAGWMFKFKMSAEPQGLMNAEEYMQYCQSL